MLPRRAFLACPGLSDKDPRGRLPTVPERRNFGEMISELIDHPVLGGLAFLSAVPIVGGLVKAFLSSAKADIEGAISLPVLGLLWFPDWSVQKVFWLTVVTTAVTVSFYKIYSVIGEWVGVLA